MSGQSRGESRRFHIHTCLGSGGFGEVYRATMISPGGVQHEVAVKVLHEGLDPKSQAVQRLRDEGRMLGILRHPAILSVHDLVVLNGRVAMIAEYIEGGDLDLAFRLDMMPLRPLLEVIAQVASALEVAWETLAPETGEPLRLVHRDVKPANIRVGVHGQVKLLDFGIAKADGLRREARTQARAVLGSYAYMAPERLMKQGAPDPSGDIFSLGCVLYEGLARRRLSSGMDLRDQLEQAQHPETQRAYVREAVDALHSVDPRARDLLLEMLSFDADLRPKPGELAARCEALADELPGTNLRQWARQFKWSVPMDAQGALAGQILTESAIVSDAYLVDSKGGEGRDSETMVDFFGSSDPPSEEEPSHTAPPVQFPKADPRARTVLSASDTGSHVSQAAQPAVPRSTETVLVPSAASPPAPPTRDEPAPPRKAGLGWSVAVVAALGGGALALVVAVALAVAAWAWMGTGPESATEVVPTPELQPALVRPEPAPAPAPKPEAEVARPRPAPAPAPAPAPSTDAPQPVVAPAPQPDGPAPVEDPVEEPQEAEPEPEPEPVATTGRVTVQGRVPVELRARGQTLPPGEVPVGSWDVYADFGSGMVKALPGAVIVGVGTEHLVRCSSVKQKCSL